MLVPDDEDTGVHIQQRGKDMVIKTYAVDIVVATNADAIVKYLRCVIVDCRNR